MPLESKNGILLHEEIFLSLLTLVFALLVHCVVTVSLRTYCGCVHKRSHIVMMTKY